MNPKKILILYTSVGLGHKVIAENIGWHLQQAGFDVRLADIGKVQKGKFEKITIAIHQFINRSLPFVWGWLYRWGYIISLPFRMPIASLNYKNTKALVDEYQPDLIITTQTTASAVVSYLLKRGLYGGKFAIAFSDYHLHPYWLYDRADFYLANTEDQKTEMAERGIAAEKIFVCGIALKPKIQVDAAAVRRKLGIADNQKIVLVGTGSLGIGFKSEDLIGLSQLPNAKIIFACGKNRGLYEKISSQNLTNVIPLKFYSPMAELYAIADIFVGKPGGLSTAESLQYNLPLLVTFTLPGQEEKNVSYLSSRHLIMVRDDNLAEQVERELRTHQFRGQLANNQNVKNIAGGGLEIVRAVQSVL